MMDLYRCRIEYLEKAVNQKDEESSEKDKCMLEPEMKTTVDE